MFEIIAAIALAAADTASPASIEGRWVNPTKSVIIDVAPCGEAMCGTVVWADAQARQDAKKGTPELIGTQLLKDLQPKGATWEGKLFVPDRGLHVEARLQPEGSGELKVSGCEIGICESQAWARSEGALPAVN